MMYVNSPASLQVEWFDRKGAYLTPKNGYEDLIASAIRGQQEAKAASVPAGNGSRKAIAALSEEQVKGLAQKYDPKDMSQEEFGSFVDDLCQMGVLKDEDKPYLAGGAGLAPLSGTRISMTPASMWDAPPSYNWSFSSCKGDVISWANYLSTFQELNPYTQSFEKGKQAILFETIAGVLEKIQCQRV